MLAISFIGAILLGTVLLLLPFSTHSGHISLVDALFTSTSAICVTGLTVKDIATYFTPFGQTVIMVLFQLGGLGIMTFSTLILLVSGRKISIQDKIIIQSGYHHTSTMNVKYLIRTIFLYTIVIESVGTALLFLQWHKRFPGLKGLFHSLFHAISAFCNAGLSLFSDSFVSFREDLWINIILILLIVLGGLGFLVLSESFHIFPSMLRRRKIKISLHSKMVWTVTFFLIGFSLALFLLIEWNKSLEGFSVKEKILSSLFQVITPRTAGFNTMDLNNLEFSTIFLLILLMFVGASPGSTGGGVKTSTVGVIFASLKSKIAGRESVNLFYRTLPLELIMRAFILVTLSMGLIFLSSFALFLTQYGMSMKEIFFEVFSAFGTVGLSLGITANLTAAGKVVLVITMFIGRIGPLTLLYAFSRKKALGKFEYVEETVMIG